MYYILVLPLAWFIDRILGEPRQYHPLVIYGNYVSWVEKKCYSESQKLSGILALLLALLPALLFFLLELLSSVWVYWIFAIIFTYITMSYRGLCEHVVDIQQALANSDIALARIKLAKIVSRDTSSLNEKEISAACIESLLENGNDAIFGVWFWWLVAGIPGIVLYRMANTLDAMWGYKNERYLNFGWAAARLDDVLNYLPARTTALCYCLAGNCSNGWQCWQAQGKHWKSPNAGPVMAAGAGSLNLKLGGVASYHGTEQYRPDLGSGKSATHEDIKIAIALLRNALWIWLVLATVILLISSWLVKL